MKRLAALLMLLLFLPGCIRQQPVLSGAPTPVPTPTPAPSAVTSMDRVIWETDALGAAIYDEARHFERYLAFQKIRVFEYEGSTLMEGICENAYPEALSGGYEIVFQDKDDVEVARAKVLIRGEEDVFAPGKNTIYAAIDTDMNILMMQFTLEATETIVPKAA